jgi:hypothetical protein
LGKVVGEEAKRMWVWGVEAEREREDWRRRRTEREWGRWEVRRVMRGGGGEGWSWRVMVGGMVAIVVGFVLLLLGIR